jgi:hypothetical protein
MRFCMQGTSKKYETEYEASIGVGMKQSVRRMRRRNGKQIKTTYKIDSYDDAFFCKSIVYEILRVSG